MGRAIKLFNIDMDDNGRPRRFSTEGRGRIATFRNCVFLRVRERCPKNELDRQPTGRTQQLYSTVSSFRKTMSEEGQMLCSPYTSSG